MVAVFLSSLLQGPSGYPLFSSVPCIFSLGLPSLQLWFLHTKRCAELLSAVTGLLLIAVRG